MRCRQLATIFVIVAGLAGRTSAQPDDLGWLDFESLASGDVVVDTIASDRGTVHIDLAIAIEADRQVIWDILTACEISPEYVPHVISCRRVASIEDCDCELFEQTIKPAFFLPRFDHIFKLEYFRPGTIEVSHVSGPLDRMEGSWRLLERPDNQTVLVHSLTLKPGFPVPRMFVRNSLRRDLPKVLREIRARAETTDAAQSSRSL